MKEDKKRKTVQVDEDVVNRVKERKKKTWMPVGVFFEIAAKEKLAREENENVSRETSENTLTNQ